MIITFSEIIMIGVGYLVAVGIIGLMRMKAKKRRILGNTKGEEWGKNVSSD